MAEVTVGPDWRFASAQSLSRETVLASLTASGTVSPGWARSRPAPARAADEAAKRALDVVGALLILLLLSPLLLAAAVAVKATSPGPVFFRQARYGRGGRVFSIYKFRTMTGAPRDAAAIGDPSDHHARMTPVGDVLRRYCIDELPQLLNVFSGEMSLVGPRAHPVGLHVLGVPYETVVPTYHRRHAVRPGMTGLAQVVGYCGIVDSVEHARLRVASDILYIGVRGLRFDCALIVYTAWRFLMRGGRGNQPFPLGWFLPEGVVAARTAA